MNNIVFFNLNRITYKGGAEGYIIDVGNNLSDHDYGVIYVGDFRFFLKIFILVGLFLRNITFKKFRQLIREVGSYPVVDNKRVNFDVEQIDVKIFYPFSKIKKKIKSIMKKADAVFVKNELIDMLFYYFFIPKASKKYCIIFTSIFYPEPKTIRAKVHNFFYVSFLYKILLKKYDGVIVSNKFDQQFLIDKFKIKSELIFYIPYGIDYQKMIKEKVDFNLNLNSDLKKILFVGRLEEQKGVGDLIKIIESVDGKHYQFIIVGDGPLRSLIEQVVTKNSNVLYLGQQPREKIISIYELVDVVVVLSKWETFCYVALEAQLCGKPVLCYDIAGPNEIVVNDVSGKIIQGGYEEIILNLDNNYSVDVDYFADKFSIDSVLEKYKHILKQC